MVDHSALLDSLKTGFVDHGVLSNEDLQPKLVVNKPSENKKVLVTLLSELDKCDEFWFSVAFVTRSGIATIINALEDIKLKNTQGAGIKGKILVSQYLNFTDPEALKAILKYDFIELKIDTESKFHAKTYLFRQGCHYTVIVGSSNLTDGALTHNAEWNFKFTSHQDGQVIHDILQTKTSVFELAEWVTNRFIQQYQELYREQKRLTLKSKITFDKEITRISPNKMQEKALANLAKLRNIDAARRALVISATGTGKTFLSAFDANAMKARRLLFIVHRQNIAKKSMESYRKILGDSVSFGLFSGDRKEADADFVFSTVQTLTKDQHLAQFDSDHFDYIVIDETHRAAAKTYTKIIDYFEPKFLLGMTATPERTDGEDIFKLFNHNIAYEIRLKDALEANLLTTFHYYGVSDITVDGQGIEKDSAFNLLVSSERVKHILQKIELYGTDNGIVRGLVFCSSVQEAKELARIFTAKGLASIALSGEDSESVREEAINRLESFGSDKLDYIFTVDIFNEGIDIPSVNQIIMLRATQSAIIFVQQLGRGLRKANDKSYVTVIDFIGNYENNYMIPIALFGDSSYSKDRLRKLVAGGSLGIPGASTIDFDRIAKQKIFDSINKAQLNKKALLQQEYKLLKYRLGRVPMMMDFLSTDARDPYCYVEYSKSYFNFVAKEEQELNHLTADQIKILEYFAAEINDAKRVIEPFILSLLLEGDAGVLNIDTLKACFMQRFKFEVDDATIQSAIHNLNFDFQFVSEDKKNKTWRNTRLLTNSKLYDVVGTDHTSIWLTKEFSQELEEDTFRKFFQDNYDYAILRYEQLLVARNYEVQNGFILYEKYSRKNVFRILNWAENPLAQNVGGYMISKDKNDCAIFVNYHKTDGISDTTKYEDEFLDQHTFRWYSKSKRKLNSPDVTTIRTQAKNGILLPLFVKKSNDEGQDFYYMGELVAQPDSFIQETMGGDDKPVSVVKCDFTLTPPVEESLYKYIMESSL